MKNFCNKWEHVPACSGRDLYRMKVPGGWLVNLEFEIPESQMMMDLGYQYQQAGSLSFVPDQFHEWDPKKPVEVRHKWIKVIANFVILVASFTAAIVIAKSLA